MLKHCLFLSVLSLVLSTGCSDFQKISKSGNPEEKFLAAKKYYEKKDNFRASALLNDVYPLSKGTSWAEECLFLLAMTHYNGKEYVMSSYYFKEFYLTFPRSALAEEAQYMYVKSLYKDSPRYNLDQSNTESAMNAAQSFANRYPKSQYMDELSNLVGELNSKMAKKEFEKAKLYYRIGQYKSAVVAFNSFLTDFNGSLHEEEALFTRFEAQYELAKRSVTGKKQIDRYYEAIDYYQKFVDKYPSSGFKKGADELFQECQKKLKAISGT